MFEKLYELECLVNAFIQEVWYAKIERLEILLDEMDESDVDIEDFISDHDVMDILSEIDESDIKDYVTENFYINDWVEVNWY